jgi:hypothetical protein
VIFNGLYGIIAQKAELFVTTVVRTIFLLEILEICILSILDDKTGVSVSEVKPLVCVFK